MRQLLKAVTLLAAASLLSACLPLSGVYTYNPNPVPPPGYKVVCSSFPGILYPLFHDVYSNCTPVIAPEEQVVVVRSKG
jgi:hypothetical protein